MCIRDRADLAGDRDPGARVVAGDHDDPDAGGMATRDRGRNRCAGWVFEPDQPGEDHVPVSYTHLDVYKRQSLMSLV